VRECARHLNREELAVAPGAALAHRRVRAAGAAARTWKLVPASAALDQRDRE
jgi:hypothetical protein